ncbi:MAG: hypothetical protein SGI96_21225 [Bacteroidota bacterium]|nr:hypothetical protein [Bacteroidota bacterium]
MTILEFKYDANGEGNSVIPNWANHSIAPMFYKAANHTHVGIRLSDAIKVPDAVLRIADRAALKTRNRGAGLQKLDVDGVTLIAMTNAECDAATDVWCNLVGIA